MRKPSTPYCTAPIATQLATLLAIVVSLGLGGCSSHRFAEPEVGSTQRGLASWYGEPFHGRATASGETYDMHGLTAAHRDLPLGSKVRVKNLDNGREAIVRVNDRGPFIRGRILDLSYGAAKALRVVGPGTARVEIEVLEVGEGPGRYPPFGDFRYTVQVGAFREAANAEAALSQLRQQGFEAEIRSAKGLFRVQAGDFKKRAEAEALLRKLRRRGWKAVIVALS